MTALQQVTQRATRTENDHLNRTQQVAQALANSRDKLERPFRLIERLYELGSRHMGYRAPLPGTQRAGVWAQQWLTDVGDLSEVEALHRELLAANDAPADRSSARITLGLLLSAYPNAGKEPKEEFFATLLHDVTDEGINPFVLAEACRRVRRTKTFIPTVSELLAVCENERRRLRDAAETARRFIEIRDDCMEVVRIHALPVTEWPEDVWANAVFDRVSCQVGDAHPWDKSLLGPAPGEPGCHVPPSIIARLNLRPEQ